MAKIDNNFKVEMYEEMLSIHGSLNQAGGLIDIGEQVPNDYLQDAIGKIKMAKEKFETKMSGFVDEENETIKMIADQFDGALKLMREINEICDADHGKSLDLLDDVRFELTNCSISIMAQMGQVNETTNSKDR